MVPCRCTEPVPDAPGQDRHDELARRRPRRHGGRGAARRRGPVDPPADARSRRCPGAAQALRAAGLAAPPLREGLTSACRGPGTAASCWRCWRRRASLSATPMAPCSARRAPARTTPSRCRDPRSSPPSRPGADSSRPARRAAARGAQVTAGVVAPLDAAGGAAGALVVLAGQPPVRRWSGRPTRPRGSSRPSSSWPISPSPAPIWPGPRCGRCARRSRRTSSTTR